MTSECGKIFNLRLPSAADKRLYVAVFTNLAINITVIYSCAEWYLWIPTQNTWDTNNKNNYSPHPYRKREYSLGTDHSWGGEGGQIPPKTSCKGFCRRKHSRVTKQRDILQSAYWKKVETKLLVTIQKTFAQPPSPPPSKIKWSVSCLIPELWITASKLY